MIKYLGSKRQLIPEILDAVKQAAPGARSVLDLFSGTSRVGHALKQAGFQVYANDHNTYAFMLAKCYVETDLEDIENAAKKLIDEFNRLPGKPGYFTQNFCEDARFFHPQNGEKIDAIRDAIEAHALSDELKAVLLVSLMEAADRVDSTCGLQMAYLKQWAPRAKNPLALRLPDVLPRAVQGKGKALCLDANQAAQTVVDVAYLDPPYNQHSYRGNYHIWETLMRWDKPEAYGRARKRVDCKSVKSAFNSKVNFLAAFREVILALKAKSLVVSFNNEGFISRQEMEALLSQKGKVDVRAIDYKRYVGAQIGIYNPKGERVGKARHLYNQEYLYIVTA